MQSFPHFITDNSLIQNDFIMLGHQFTILDDARMFHTTKDCRRKKQKEKSRWIYHEWLNRYPFHASVSFLFCFMAAIVAEQEKTRNDRTLSSKQIPWHVQDMYKWTKGRVFTKVMEKVQRPVRVLMAKANFPSLKNQFHPRNLPSLSSRRHYVRIALYIKLLSFVNFTRLNRLCTLFYSYMMNDVCQVQWQYGAIESLWTSRDIDSNGCSNHF